MLTDGTTELGTFNVKFAVDVPINVSPSYEVQVIIHTPLVEFGICSASVNGGVHIYWSWSVVPIVPLASPNWKLNVSVDPSIYLVNDIVTAWFKSIEELSKLIPLALAIFVKVLVPLALTVPNTLVPVAQLQLQLTDLVPSLLWAILSNVNDALAFPPLGWAIFLLFVTPLQVQYNVSLEKYVEVLLALNSIAIVKLEVLLATDILDSVNLVD